MAPAACCCCPCCRLLAAPSSACAAPGGGVERCRHAGAARRAELDEPAAAPGPIGRSWDLQAGRSGGRVGLQRAIAQRTLCALACHCAAPGRTRCCPVRNPASTGHCFGRLSGACGLTWRGPRCRQITLPGAGRAGTGLPTIAVVRSPRSGRCRRPPGCRTRPPVLAALGSITGPGRAGVCLVDDGLWGS